MGGASREAWLVDVERDDGTTCDLFLRRDNGTGPMQGTPYTIGREATVYRALASTPVPVPAVVASHPDGNTVLLERVEGEAYFPAAGDAREQLAEQFVEILAALHTTDVRTLDLPLLVTPAHPRGARHPRARHLGAAAARARPPRPAGHVHPALAARPRAHHRRSHRPRAGRHRPRQLHVPRRADRCGRRLGARAPRRPDGRPRVGDHPLAPAALRAVGAVVPPLPGAVGHRASTTRASTGGRRSTSCAA